MVSSLTSDQVRELLDYNPSTGKFYWGNSPRFGQELRGGPHPRGYITLRLNGKHYLAHRVAWLYVHGEWPAFTIDHINGVKTDNRIANLRDVTALENIRAYFAGRNADGVPA